MKKNIIFFCAIACTLHADTLSQAFEKASVDGQIRVVHYSRSADNSRATLSNGVQVPIFSKVEGTAIGTNLGLSTAPIYNVKANVRFFSAHAIMPNDTLLPSTYLVDGNQNYALMGEANLEYTQKNFSLKLGRQTLKTPLLASDDARVVKDHFEAANFSTTIIPSTTLHALYVHKNSGMDNGSSNYNSAVSAKDFVSISRTLGTSYDEGMAIVGIENNTLANVTFNAWYYHGIKLIDMFYIDTSFSMKVSDIGLKLEAHYWDIKSQSEYEEDTSKKIDYNYGGARGTLAYNNFVFQFAQEQINYKEGTHGIHTAWGMYSEYTYGFNMGSGIYGALNGFGGITDNYVTKVNASKVTAIYNFTDEIMLYGSYNWWRGNNDDFQSNLNVADILVAWPCQFVDNATWQVVYENWNSKTNNIMADNDLVRAKFIYSF